MRRCRHLCLLRLRCTISAELAVPPDRAARSNEYHDRIPVVCGASISFSDTDALGLECVVGLHPRRPRAKLRLGRLDGDLSRDVRSIERPRGLAGIGERRLCDHARRSSGEHPNHFRTRVPDPFLWRMHDARASGIQHSPDHHHPRVPSPVVASGLHRPCDLQRGILAFAAPPSHAVAGGIWPLHSQKLDPVFRGSKGSSELRLVQARLVLYPRVAAGRFVVSVQPGALGGRN